jgi:sulfite reductase (NADPH) flavoprotein alpha-component
MNADSQGKPCFHLVLTPESSEQFSWQAGDILEVAPRRTLDGALEPARDYSIASLLCEGGVHLLVRQRHDELGALGLASAWLTHLAPLDQRIDARIRINRNFHAPADDRPLILIGNGTGIAGLPALLKARIAQAHHKNWLIFGERNAAHDWLWSS